MSSGSKAQPGDTAPGARRAAPAIKKTQRTAPSGDALLVIASPRAEARERWVGALQCAVTEASERKALEQAMLELQPRVLVLHLALPGLRGARSVRELLRLCPGTRVIVLTDRLSDAEGILALRCGARGYCSSALAPEVLAKAVDAVESEEIWATRRLVSRLVAELVAAVDSRRKTGRTTKPDPRLAGLTERQRVVADLISRGASNKEIGNRLNISERTVKAHLTEAFRSVGVPDRLHLALLLQGYPRASGDD